MLSAASLAQTTAPAAPPAQAPGLECNGTRILDPFKGKLAVPALAPEVLASAIANKDSILKSGLPCQENVGTGAQPIRLELKLPVWKTCSEASIFIRGALFSR